MKYTREERQEIGRRIYEHELTCQQAAEEYGIHIHTAKRYLWFYRDTNGLQPQRARMSAERIAKAKATPSAPEDISGYESMTKEELIRELVLSDPYAHKCCKAAGIKSKTNHYRYKKPGEPGRVYPNLLLSEINVDGPMQCIVSDMTAFYVKGVYYELTLYMDLWNNEIVSHALSSRRGDRMTYISGLEDLLALKQQFPEHEMILHSDQGSVYSSKKYNELLPMYGITRSMSRAGTPTDNAAMEAINGWIKAELFADQHVTGDKPVAQEIDDYVIFFNEQRPAYSLNYFTPKQYREKFSCVQFY